MTRDEALQVLGLKQGASPREVRLAYLVEGEKRTPLTGISISGKLSAVLPTIRLSQQQRTYENYCGPAFALLDNVTVF